MRDPGDIIDAVAIRKLNAMRTRAGKRTLNGEWMIGPVFLLTVLGKLPESP